jgi:hypothetical protein
MSEANRRKSAGELVPPTEPLHVAEINDHRLRFFRPPSAKPDRPWCAITDLFECFGLEEFGRVALRHMCNRWNSSVCTVVTFDGPVRVVSHNLAQGFLKAIEDVGQVPKGAFDIYAEASTPAMQKLVKAHGLAFGSPEYFAWMKQAAGMTEKRAALDPNTALFLAAEKHGELVERDGEPCLRIRMPE